MAKKYDSTIARIAGNLLSGVHSEPDLHRIAQHGVDDLVVKGAVVLARAIVAEVEASEPRESEDVKF